MGSREVINDMDIEIFFTNALGSIDFVTGHRHQVDLHLVHVDGHLSAVNADSMIVVVMVRVMLSEGYFIYITIRSR